MSSLRDVCSPLFILGLVSDGGIANEIIESGIGRTFTVGETAVECCNHLGTSENVWQNTLDNCGDINPFIIYNSTSGLCEVYTP